MALAKISRAAGVWDAMMASISAPTSALSALAISTTELSVTRTSW